MSLETPKLIASFSFGTGAGFDLQLAAYARQLAEDFAQILALLDSVVAIPRFILLPQSGSILEQWEERASAFAVFYSLPDTRFILRACAELGADYALTGRLVDTEGGVILSVNLVDAERRLLLFSGQCEVERDGIMDAIIIVGCRLLGALSESKAEDWREKVIAMLGTTNFRAYSNWVSYRECQRRSVAQKQQPPYDRMAEHIIYALKEDPKYENALRELPALLRRDLSSRTKDLLISQLQGVSAHNETIALSLAWMLRKREQMELAISVLDSALTHKESALLYLMRALCKEAKDPLGAKYDDERAVKLLGEAQFASFREALRRT
ncbi:MAG: hypothetical protein WC966_04995 [Bradymonadales bacterium]|jgi:tetratricopeptide (TPR) repeat protein